jgi:hypothetical protein
MNMIYTIPRKKELDRFRHITYKIEDLWGTKYCRPYLVGLALSSSGRVNENAVGFSIDTFKAIDEITAEHDRQFPKFVPKDKWDFTT